MKVAIVYDSLTGNTHLVADELKKVINPEDLVYFGSVQDNIEADLYIVGSWTDKGSCSGKIAQFLRQLNNKTIAFFATAGFGGSEEYYQAIFERIRALINDSNQVLEPFFCQGKMPASVLARYQKMAESNPNDPKIQQSIDNYYQALPHPNEEDLAKAKDWLKKIIAK